MVERREYLRFAGEACKAIGAQRERFGQHLDRNVAIELGIARALHLAHSASAKLGETSP